MLHSTAAAPQRVILAGLDTRLGRGMFEIEMDELEALAQAAGGEVVARCVQRRTAVDPSTLVGQGKAEEIAQLARDSGAELVVTLNALRPRQRAALENIIGDDVAVMDRTVLILDIFARHARTSEGKLQVELAQLRHRAANLIGTREALSRLGGGIGTRGPGETKLEVDRRRIRLRISHLEKQLELVRKRRAEQRRSRAGTPIVALVGYTNAGKSSLLNALSGSDVLVADQPFATLDPTLRSVRLAPEHEAIIADTVGFISDLPKELVVAFRATLEEVTNATLLLHVIDASNPYWQRQRESVISVLSDLNAEGKPIINVWNKIDRVSQPLRDTHTAASTRGADLGEAGVLVSARSGAGIQELKSAIAARLSSLSASVSVL